MVALPRRPIYRASPKELVLRLETDTATVLLPPADLRQVVSLTL
jgi:hypothetical protein